MLPQTEGGGNRERPQARHPGGNQYAWPRPALGERRRGRDSNPGQSFWPRNRLAGGCLQPLGHLSEPPRVILAHYPRGNKQAGPPSERCGRRRRGHPARDAAGTGTGESSDPSPSGLAGAVSGREGRRASGGAGGPQSLEPEQQAEQPGGAPERYRGTPPAEHRRRSRTSRQHPVAVRRASVVPAFDSPMRQRDRDGRWRSVKTIPQIGRPSRPGPTGGRPLAQNL